MLSHSVDTGKFPDFDLLLKEPGRQSMMKGLYTPAIFARDGIIRSSFYINLDKDLNIDEQFI
jgi:hypothetical protein